MKKSFLRICRKRKSITILVFACFNFLQVQTAFAQGDIAEAIIKAYNNALGAVSELLFYPDSQLAKIISTNDTLSRDQNAKVLDLSVNMGNFIDYYLSPSEKKDSFMLDFAGAYDKTSWQNTLFVLPKEGSAANEAILKNGQLNVNTFLSPLQYDEAQQKGAQTFITSLEYVSPTPKVINISSDFTVPYSKNSDEPSELQPKDPIALKNKVMGEPIYKQYEVNYRSQIAARSFFINNFLQSYQNRVSTNGNKSLAQIEFDEANWRLQPPKDANQLSYYQEMQIAPPATVARETLFLLAELHRDLYEMRKQNERLIMLQSLIGLQSLSNVSAYNSAVETKMARTIYCHVKDPDSNTPECKDISNAIPTPMLHQQAAGIGAIATTQIPGAPTVPGK